MEENDDAQDENRKKNDEQNTGNDVGMDKDSSASLNNDDMDKGKTLSHKEGQEAPWPAKAKVKTSTSSSTDVNSDNVVDKDTANSTDANI